VDINERAEKVAKWLFKQGWLSEGVTEKDFEEAILPHFQEIELNYTRRKSNEI